MNLSPSSPPSPGLQPSIPSFTYKSPVKKDLYILLNLAEATQFKGTPAITIPPNSTKLVSFEGKVKTISSKGSEASFVNGPNLIEYNDGTGTQKYLPDSVMLTVKTTCSPANMNGGNFLLQEK